MADVGRKLGSIALPLMILSVVHAVLIRHGNGYVDGKIELHKDDKNPQATSHFEGPDAIARTAEKLFPEEQTDARNIESLSPDSKHAYHSPEPDTGLEKSPQSRGEARKENGELGEFQTIKVKPTEEQGKALKSGEIEAERCGNNKTNGGTSERQRGRGNGGGQGNRGGRRGNRTRIATEASNVERSKREAIEEKVVRLTDQGSDRRKRGDDQIGQRRNWGTEGDQGNSGGGNWNWQDGQSAGRQNLNSEYKNPQAMSHFEEPDAITGTAEKPFLQEPTDARNTKSLSPGSEHAYHSPETSTGLHKSPQGRRGEARKEKGELEQLKTIKIKPTDEQGKALKSEEMQAERCHNNTNGGTSERQRGRRNNHTNGGTSERQRGHGKGGHRGGERRNRTTTTTEASNVERFKREATEEKVVRLTDQGSDRRKRGDDQIGQRRNWGIEGDQGNIESLSPDTEHVYHSPEPISGLHKLPHGRRGEARKEKGELEALKTIEIKPTDEQGKALKSGEMQAERCGNNNTNGGTSGRQRGHGKGGHHGHRGGGQGNRTTTTTEASTVERFKREGSHGGGGGNWNSQGGQNGGRGNWNREGCRGGNEGGNWNSQRGQNGGERGNWNREGNRGGNEGGNWNSQRGQNGGERGNWNREGNRGGNEGGNWNSQEGQNGGRENWNRGESQGGTGTGSGQRNREGGQRGGGGRNNENNLGNGG